MQYRVAGERIYPDGETSYIWSETDTLEDVISVLVEFERDMEEGRIKEESRIQVLAKG